MEEKVVVNKTQVKKVEDLLKGLGMRFMQTPSRAGYNAYLLSMAMQPDTQSGINNRANVIAKVMGLGIEIKPSNNHPNYHLGHSPMIVEYLKNLSKPAIGGVALTILRPRCEKHGLMISKCDKECLYGLWVVEQKTFTSTLLASGGEGAKTRTKRKKAGKGNHVPKEAKAGESVTEEALSNLP